MENKEFEFKGLRINGFLMLFVVLAIIAGSIFGFTTCKEGEPIGLIIGGIAMILIDFILCIGFIKIEPNEAMVMVFFGKYQGTLTKVGFHWANPFYSSKKVSLRARNLNVDPIKVNDKTGNPIMIGQILVWKLKDTYKAMFEIDSQTLAAAGSVSGTGVQVTSRMRAFESFVRVQSDAALREVAGMFAYDENGDITKGDLTLRAGGSEINDILLGKLRDKLSRFHFLLLLIFVLTFANKLLNQHYLSKQQPHLQWKNTIFLLHRPTLCEHFFSQIIEVPLFSS